MTDTRQVALDFVNGIRRSRGAAELNALLPGMLHDELNCPISMSLKDVSADYVETTGTDVTIDGVEYPIPCDASEFITDFDNGVYPELIE